MTDVAWILWGTAVAFSLIALAYAALDTVPRAQFDPTLHYVWAS